MTDEKMVEAMARLDGIELGVEVELPIGEGYEPVKMKQDFKDGRVVYQLPDYLNSHDACQRVIDGLDIGDGERYWLCLMDVTLGRRHNILTDKIFKATPRQKCEAVLKATKGV